MIVEVLQFAKEWGLPGVVIAVLCLAIVKLHRDHGNDLRRMRNEHAEALSQLQTDLLKEKGLRIQDAKAFTKLVLRLQREVISAAGTIRDSLEIQTKSVEVIKRLVRVYESREGRREQ